MVKNWRESVQVLPEPTELAEFVPAKGITLPEGKPDRLPGDFMIDTIHDGDVIPQTYWDELQVHGERAELRLKKFEDSYTLERDWGADLVAHHLASELNALGLGCLGHHRVKIARVLMDFGRFPGNTPPDAEHLHRFAINYPFSQVLSYERKKDLLENLYDGVSAYYEGYIKDKLFKIAVHTYDTFNRAGTRRPLMSIITRPIAYQTKSEMPLDFFDPLYPSVLSESTADRRLTYRLSLMLEKADIPVAQNYPYYFPDGSIEVRSQVWFFFQFLRRHFERDFPETVEETAYLAVWKMLLDTNLRSTESENLRSYLHMFRRAPVGTESSFQEAATAYRRIRKYLLQDDSALVSKYRKFPQRPSSLAIEVRKDFVWDFADRECRQPLGPKEENAMQLAKIIASGIKTYLDSDRGPLEHESS